MERRFRPRTVAPPVLVFIVGMGCGAPGDHRGAANADATGSPDNAPNQDAPAQKVIVQQGDLFGRRWVRYRVGPDASWLVRYQRRNALYLPGRSPFVESSDAVFRVERRGVSPEGHLRFAWGLIEATVSEGNGRQRRLATFAGLKMTTAITETGSWMESRLEVPQGTPKKSIRDTEYVLPRLTFSFPAGALGRGATWTNEFLGTLTNLKTAKTLKQTKTILEIDDDHVQFNLDEEITEQPNRITVGGSGPTDFDGGHSLLHGTVTVQFDRLVAESTTTSTRKTRLKAAEGAASADSFILFEMSERISTLPAASAEATPVPATP
jgi:hypothetical protein